MNADLIERLSEAVHQGWEEEKIAQGFADHVFVGVAPSYPQTEGRGRCIANGDEPVCTISADKHHTDMLPYAALSEPTKEYDRATVRAVLRALDAAGLQIVQATTNEAAPR